MNEHIDNQNDAVRAQVELEMPTPAGGFETDIQADEHLARHNARFMEIVNAQATTMNTNFTPGPWLTLGNYSDSLHFSSLAIYNQDWMPILYVNGNVSETDRNTSNANARLIMAAPEMFEALQGVVNCPDFRNIKTHEISKARAALAKAGGKEGV